MKLKTIVSQRRRDFIGIYECEDCHTEDEKRGYDDDYFHQNVTPKMKCSNCGKTTLDLNIPIEPVQTKYSPWETV